MSQFKVEQLEKGPNDILQIFFPPETGFWSVKGIEGKCFPQSQLKWNKIHFYSSSEANIIVSYLTVTDRESEDLRWWGRLKSA